MNIDDYLNKNRKFIDKALLKNLPAPSGLSKRLTDAMRYSVLVGGKRIRPILMLAIAEMLNKPYTKVLPAACAVEYVHTSTLILDDLPCMDDSDLRRGRPSVHRKFGQSTAILASYSLMILAFKLLAENASAIRYLSEAAGPSGICAGQFVDLKSAARKINRDTLTYLHKHKTADLFAASCRIAGVLSGAKPAQFKALGDYGRYLGLAFQVCDDMLSIDKSDAELGKQTKKDRYSPNVVNLFGLRKTRGLLDLYAKKAKSQLSPFAAKAKILGGILEYVIHREK